jgi:hypothetical protein
MCTYKPTPCCCASAIFNHFITPEQQYTLRLREGVTHLGHANQARNMMKYLSHQSSLNQTHNFNKKMQSKILKIK